MSFCVCAFLYFVCFVVVVLFVCWYISFFPWNIFFILLDSS